MSFLVIDQVSKVYDGPRGGVAALQDVSFAVQRGEFVVIRGPSGCGKSTLLHILGAMDWPTAGSVRLNDRELSALSSQDLTLVRRRQIGFVFQSFYLFPTLSVLENVMLPLTLDGAPESAARRRAESLLQDVDLASRASHFPAQLSGGETQRIAIARSISAKPELLLADEPTGNLDSDNGERVMQLLAQINQRFDLTVLLATHSDEAAEHACRSVYLRDGRMVRDVR